MSWQDELLRLADGADRATAALLRRWREGAMREDAFAGGVVYTISWANQVATIRADLALAAFLSRWFDSDVPALGLGAPEGDLARLEKAMETLMGELPTTPDPEARLSRLSRAEPLEAGRAGFHTAMQERRVPGWRRATAGAACELCRRWAAGGVFPVSTSMLSHPGCSCVQEPVMERAEVPSHA